MKTHRVVAHLRTFSAAALIAVTTPVWFTGLLAQSAPSSLPLQIVSDIRPNWLSRPAESPNGRFYLLHPFAGDTLLSYDRIAKRWSALPDVNLGQNVSWSPNGRFVTSWKVVAGRQSVLLTPIDTATGLPSGPARRISTRAGRWPVWSPSGDRIAFVSQDSGTFKVVVVPFNGGNETVLFEAPPGPSGGIAWSPDGKRILFEFSSVDRPAAYHLIDVTTRAVTTKPSTPAGMLLGLSADGTRMAHFDRNTNLLTVSSVSDWRVLLKQQTGNVTPVAWSRSNPNEMIGAQHIVPTHLQQATFPGGSISSLTTPDSVLGLGRPIYSPDGSQIAFGRGAAPAVRIHVMARSGGAMRAIGEPGVIGRPHWSPSGRSVAYCGPQEVHVVDVASGRDQLLVRVADNSRILHLQCGWRANGTAIRYIKIPQYVPNGVQELREVSITGEDRLIARLDGAVRVTPQLLDDTLVVLRSATEVVLKNLRDNSTRSLFKGSPSSRDVGRSPDGRSLVFGVWEGNKEFPVIVDVISGAGRRISYTLGGELSELDFHPDGRHLVTSACLTCVEPGYVEKWETVVVPLNGDPVRVLTAVQPTYSDHGRPDVAPDGRSIVFEGQTSYNTRIVRISVPPNN